MTIPLARSSFVAGSRLIISSASSMVSVGDRFSSRLAPMASKAQIGDGGNTEDVASSFAGTRFVRSEQELTRIKYLTNQAIVVFAGEKRHGHNDDGLNLGLDLSQRPVVLSEKHLSRASIPDIQKQNAKRARRAVPLRRKMQRH